MQYSTIYQNQIYITSCPKLSLNDFFKNYLALSFVGTSFDQNNIADFLIWWIEAASSTFSEIFTKQMLTVDIFLSRKPMITKF